MMFVDHGILSGWRRRSGLGCLVAWFFFVTGCSHEEEFPVYHVSGSAHYRGQPAVAAHVYLHPTGFSLPPSVRPSGVVGEDGFFRISTFRAFDGAPPGSYRVSVIWLSDQVKDDGENAGPDRLKGKYRNPDKNPWQVTVESGDNVMAPMELK